MDESEKRQLLKDEYLHIQNVIEGFDGRAITIKSWSITFSFAALVGAFVSHSPAVFLLAGFSAVLFWLIEGYWKTFQYAYYDRSGKIEDYFAEKRKDIIPLQIGRDWFKRWQGGGSKRLWRIMFWSHVALPHVAIVATGARNAGRP